MSSVRDHWLVHGVRCGLALLLLDACSKHPSALRKAPAASAVQPVAPVPPSAATAPIAESPMALTTAARSAQAVLVDSGRASDWDSVCRIHRACPRTPPLATCSVSLTPLDALATDELGGRAVVLRGELSLGAGFETAVVCTSSNPRVRPCCNGASRPGILMVGGTPVTLSGLGCGGDESRLCCGVPAFGQRVVASGYLGYTGDHQPMWRLRDAGLCLETTAKEH